MHHGAGGVQQQANVAQLTQALLEVLALMALHAAQLVVGELAEAGRRHRRRGQLIGREHREGRRQMQLRQWNKRSAGSSGGISSGGGGSGSGGNSGRCISGRCVSARQIVVVGELEVWQLGEVQLGKVGQRIGERKDVVGVGCESEWTGIETNSINIF